MKARIAVKVTVDVAKVIASLTGMLVAVAKVAGYL